MTSFMEAWERTVCIDGWLNEGEARLLFETAAALPEGSKIVEIGSYRGRSTTLLANTGHTVWAIDPLDTSFGDGNNMRITDADAEKLQANLSRYPNARWFSCSSTNFIASEPIAMVFIDGDHREPEPLRDFRHLRQWLVPGSKVAFHDYGVFEGVTKAVDYLVNTGQLMRVDVKNSLFVGVVPLFPRIRPLAPGFHMLVMCHKFGRRARAFMQSLVEQQNMEFDIEVNMFFSRKQDLELAYEGWADTHAAHSRRIDFRPYPIDERHIMHRAQLFSLFTQFSVLRDWVLYTDCDLWFPPTFFADYARALEVREPGYWSAWIEDISEDDAELLLPRWRSLTDATLRKYSCGPRYDWGKGTAGHFQCVPHSLANYPPSKIKGVSQADDQFARWAKSQSPDKSDERRIGAVRAYHLGHPYSWEGTEVEL